MINETRVKLMTKLALYESKQGKQDFKISEYHAKDYKSINRLYTCLWITFGYILALGLAGVASFTWITQNLSLQFILTILGVAGGGYVLLLLIYIVIATDFYQRKYTKARKNVKKYNHDLIRLKKMYEKENV